MKRQLLLIITALSLCAETSQQLTSPDLQVTGGLERTSLYALNESTPVTFFHNSGSSSTGVGNPANSSKAILSQ